MLDLNIAKSAIRVIRKDGSEGRRLNAQHILCSFFDADKGVLRDGRPVVKLSDGSWAYFPN